jgi:lysophospholipase L1-like esterase
MPKRICIFGDSIVRGGIDKEKGGWANRLRLFLESKDDDVRTYNLGVSGNNSNDLIKRFNIEAEAREPGIIIFAIGTNDAAYAKSKKGNYVPIENFKENLEILKQRAEKLTLKIIFIGLTKADEEKTLPIPWHKDFYHKNKNIREYDRAIKYFCEKNNLPFIEMFDLLDNDDLADGLHPNSAGHEKIFQRVKDFLIKNKII